MFYTPDMYNAGLTLKNLAPNFMHHELFHSIGHKKLANVPLILVSLSVLNWLSLLDIERSTHYLSHLDVV